MLELRWMWADAGGPIHKLAANNPFRWSYGGVDKIVKELMAEPTHRPVKLSVGGGGEHNFDFPAAAVRWICRNLVEMRVRFQVRCGTEFGQHLVLTGTPPELGTWDPGQGLRLQTSPEDYPIWTSDELKCTGLLSRFEYKFVVCSGSAGPRWEDGPNRSLQLLEALEDLGEPGSVTVLDSTVGLTVRAPQVRFEPTTPGPLHSFPLVQQAPVRTHQEAQATSGSEVLSRSQWSCSALSTHASVGPGSFGASCFPQMVWDHRSANDTSQIDDRYSMGSKIGHGTFGLIRSAQLKRGCERPRAVKQIRKTHIGDIEDFNREVRMMELMDHPNTLRLFEVFEDHRFVYLVTELCEGGDMLNFMLCKRNEGCSEPEAAHFLRQMAGALQHCHRQGVAHRDVKLENLLVVERSRPARESHVKLCDMGLANRVPPEGFDKACGSLTTLAPEVLMTSVGGPPYGVSCDMWSLGSVLYSMLSCNVAQGPEVGDDWKRLLKRGKYDMTKRPWPDISVDAVSLVRSLMCLDIGKRLSAEGCLQHRWLSQEGPNRSFKPVAAMSLGTAEKMSQGLNRWFGQCRLGHFRKTALHVLAQQGGASGHLKEAFQSLDRDKDGQVSLQQLVDVLATILPGGEDNTCVREWRESILPVLPADAALGQTEFLAATMSAEIWMEEDRCWDVFRFFDRDRDGTISLDDLDRAFPEAQARARRGFAEEVAALGGRITFGRFVQLMREAVRPQPPPQPTPPPHHGGGGADSGAGGEARGAG